MSSFSEGPVILGPVVSPSRFVSSFVAVFLRAAGLWSEGSAVVRPPMSLEFLSYGDILSGGLNGIVPFDTGHDQRPLLLCFRWRWCRGGSRIPSARGR